MKATFIQTIPVNFYSKLKHNACFAATIIFNWIPELLF